MMNTLILMSDENIGDSDGFREPLLDHNNDNNDDDDDDDDDALEVVSNARIERRVIMPPCCCLVSCVIRRTWMSILLGFLVGGSTVLYMYASNKAISYIWKWNNEGNDPRWLYPLLILLAALLSASLGQWLGPGERQIQNYFQTSSSSSSVSQSIEVMLSSTICSIIGGAPFGPELTLVAGAAWFAQLVVKIFSFQNTNQNNNDHRMIHVSSIAATLGGIVQLPIAILLGPVITIELMTTTTITTTTTDRALLAWLQLVSISASSLTRQWLVGIMKIELSIVPLLVSSKGVSVEWKHMFLAIPIGILCGMVGGSFHLLSRWLEKIRIWIRERTFGLLPAIMAATLYSGIVYFFPSVVGSGWTIVEDIWNHAEKDWISVDSKTDVLAKIHDYGTMALIKVAALLICMGLGGWPGGVISPMASIGACIGWILGSVGKMIQIWTAEVVDVVVWLPATTMTVPCCTAACCVTMCSAPISTVLAFLLVWNGSLELVPPVLVACVTATCITRMMMVGVPQQEEHPSTAMPSSRRLERINGGTIGNDDDRLLAHDYNDHGISNVDDNELLRSIRSAIFGDAAFC
jgi:hypothetical protein